MSNIIVIDIGNTNTAIGLTNNCGNILENKIHTTEEFSRSYEFIINEFIIQNNLKNPLIIVSDVANVEIDKKLNNSFNICKIDNHKLPFKINYKNPADIGHDRLADLLFVYKTAKNGIVIDAGSAVTVDLLYNNTFCGGFIFPGIKLQRYSLVKNTAFLPLVEERYLLADNKTGLPDSTKSCIHYGVIYSVSGGINYIIEKIKKDYGEMEVFLTGGDSEFLKDYFNFNFNYDSLLTLKGIGMYANYI